MAKSFGSMPKYVQGHHQYAGGRPARRRELSELISHMLRSTVDSLTLSVALNPMIRLWHVGYDCEFHSAAVMGAGRDTKVEVEHIVEVAELVRHLIGKAYEGQRASQIAAEEEPAPSWEELVAALRAGGPEAQSVTERWRGVDWSAPPPDFQAGPDIVYDFLSSYCHRCLVTPAEHVNLQNARRGWTQNTIGLTQPAGAYGGRYERAGVFFTDIRRNPRPSHPKR